jgi:hypothetical protein
MNPGDTFRSPRYKDRHTVAYDTSIAVCGRPVVDATPTTKGHLCTRCKHNDLSAVPRQAVVVESQVEPWISRIRALNAAAPRNREGLREWAELQVLAKQVARAFNAEEIV